MNGSTRSHPDVALPMMISESSLRAGPDLLFKAVGNEANDDVPIPFWEQELADENELWAMDSPKAANKKAPG